MCISAQLRRAAEALIKRDMGRFMENLLKADLAAQDRDRGQGKKARKGTTKYWLGVLEYRTRYFPRVAGHDLSST